MERLAAALHTLMCDKPHAGHMEEMLRPRDPAVCYYYLEENIADDGGPQPDHAYWLGQAQQVCDILGQPPEEAFRTIRGILEARRILQPFMSRSVKSQELVVRLLRLPS